MKYLVDSDFLVALYKPDDTNHAKANEILGNIYQKHELLILNLVLQESTTVISKRMGMKYAKSFHNSANKLTNQQISLNEEIEDEAWRLFLRQTKKGASFVDCANLATVRKFKLDGIISFDKFYPADIKIDLTH